MGWIPTGPLARKAIRAYHGSPHDFEKFDLSKIGTGEGAQAYGHGLYFAENEAVAKEYRDTLTQGLRLKNEPLDTIWNEEIRKRWPGLYRGLNEADADTMDSIIGTMHGALSMRDAENAAQSVGPRAVRLFNERVKPFLGDAPPGRMYEVDIAADPEDFLDWDKPLSEQPRILEKFQKVAAEAEPLAKNLSEDALTPDDVYLRGFLPKAKGAEAITSLGVAMGQDKATEALRKAGVKGVGYLDQGSRAAGKGSRNYVVFDDKLISIVRKYGIAGAIGLGYLTQEQGEALAGELGIPEKAEPILSEHDDPDPSFWDTTAAALQRENIIGSAATSKARMMPGDEYFRIDETYNPWEDPDLKGYIDKDETSDRFNNVFNKKAADAVRSDIDRERENDRILEASGWTGTLLEMGASIADPTILIPGGAFVRGAKLGFSGTRTAASVGAAAGIATTAQEAGLQLTQQTRTGAESAINIGASVVLAGAIGAAGARLLTRAERTQVTQKLAEELAEDVPNPADIAETIVKRAQAAGAASADTLKLDDLGIGGAKAAQALAKATEFVHLNPGVQTMFSPSKKVREIYAKLVDNPIYTKMNMRGESLGADVENRGKYWIRGQYAKWLTDANKIYKEGREAGEKMKRREFMARIGRAMRRGDNDPDSPFVSRAAQSARKTLSDPLLKEAQEIGLLPKDIKTDTALSYFHRMWNRKALEANEGRFRAITKGWLGRALDNAIAEGKASEDGARFLDQQDRDSYLDEITDSIFNNLTGRSTDDVPDWLIPATRGPLKERTFRIPDELVEEFLEDDAEIVLRRYTRTMGAETEIARKFGRADMKDQFKEIRQDYSDMRKALDADKQMPAKAKEKRRKELLAGEKRDIANLEAFRDLIRGTYRAKEEASHWGAITRAALAWNYMRLLGGVTVTSFVDAANMIGTHGLRATMSEGLPQLVKGIRGISLSINEAKELGAVTEVMLNGRLASLAELSDPYAYGSAYERFLSNATTLFSRATGLAHWNDTVKGIVSVMTQNRILRNAKIGDYSKLNKFERSYMGLLGIDQNMAGRIAKEYAEHGQKDGSALVANTHLWKDTEAKRAYAAALSKDVDRTIVTKGVADQPLWTRSNWGRLITQFKSFALASHQRVLIARLQERPHRFAEQLVFATSIGMMIAWLKHAERGDEEKANALLENPGLWISDGLDRTGILSIPFEISNTAEKLQIPFGIKSGLQTAFGDERRDLDVSRYSSRGKLGAVGGPSVGMFEDLATFASQLSQGDLKRSGVNAAIRQLPGGSLPGVKTGLYVGARPLLQELVE